MTPADKERMEALERREANAALLQAKLERDRIALEAEISASAAASKAASAINRAFQADAAKKVKELEAEGVLWEAKLAKLKADVGKATPAVPAAPSRAEEEIAADKVAIATEKASLSIERATIDAARTQLAAERAMLLSARSDFDRESAAVQVKNKAESQALAELRTKLGAIRAEIEAGVKVREAEVHKKETYLTAERNKLQEAADALMRAESQFSEQRAKMESQMAALAAKESLYEERHRQLQENMKHFVKA
jgi:chromosome segregation ATPase